MKCPECGEDITQCPVSDRRGGTWIDICFHCGAEWDSPYQDTTPITDKPTVEPPATTLTAECDANEYALKKAAKDVVALTAENARLRTTLEEIEPVVIAARRIRESLVEMGDDFEVLDTTLDEYDKRTALAGREDGR